MVAGTGIAGASSAEVNVILTSQDGNIKEPNVFAFVVAKIECEDRTLIKRKSEVNE